MTHREPNVRVTPIDVGRLRLDIGASFSLPEGDPEGGLHDIPLLAYHVAVAGRSVLVDAPACAFTGANEMYRVPGYTPPAPLPEQLRAIGHPPETIDSVVITHAHFDHFNALTRRDGDRWVPVFPRATHYLGAADWPETPDEVAACTLGVVRETGRLELVEGARDLGDGLEILPAPGESPGHQILEVLSDAPAAYVVGDLFHREMELRDMDRHARWADAEACARSRAMLVDRASAGGAPVYFAHIPGPHRVVRDGGEIRWLGPDGRRLT